MRHLTCKKCGWVYFGVSRKHAVEQTHQFSNYYNGLPKETQQECYGGRNISLIREYGRCRMCGAPNTDSRDSFPHEIQRVYGCTISGLIMPEEKVV